MNISLTGRAIELTDPIKEYLQNAIASLAKFNLDIISAQAVCAKQSTGKKQGVSVEFTINLAGNWNHVLGDFVEQNGTVILDGTGDQYIYGAETFYNLTFSNSSDLYIDSSGNVVPAVVPRPYPWQENRGGPALPQRRHALSRSRHT